MSASELVAKRARPNAAGLGELRARLQFGDVIVVPIKPMSFARARRCYANVDTAVSRFGGARVDGWAFWEYEDYFIEAEPHAVWMPPSRSAVCVTPQEEVPATDILFAAAQSATAAIGQMIPQRIILRQHADVGAYLAAIDAMNAVRHELEHRGLTFEQMIRQPRLMAALSAAEEALSSLRGTGRGQQVARDQRA